MLSKAAKRLFVVCTLVLTADIMAVCPQITWADGSDVLYTFESTHEDSAYIKDSSFGINAFERSAKGTSRVVSGAPEGYRFPLGSKANLVAVCTPQSILVYVESNAAQSTGLDLSIEDDQLKLKALIERLDENHSMGGALLSEADVPWQFTSDLSVVQGAYTYRFNAQDSEGDHYCTVTLADQPEGSAGTEAARQAGVDLGDGALWCDSAQLVSANNVLYTDTPSFTDQLSDFFTGIDYRPLWVSIKTSALALGFSVVLGLLAAWRVMGMSSRLKGALDSVFTIPMVLPPTVCGFLLLMLFGQSTAVGRWFIQHGISLVFTWPAAVLSAFVVSFPLVYRTALGAFESLDSNMLDAARTLGWSESRIFYRIMLPLSLQSLAAGTVLAFARAMGEFGCTLFFAGNYAGITQTVPIAIYFEWMGGNTTVALFWVAVIIAFSFLVILIINGFSHSEMRRRQGRTNVSRLKTFPFTQTKSGQKSSGNSSSVLQDELETTGGDAVRIDKEALRNLLEIKDGE